MMRRAIALLLGLAFVSCAALAALTAAGMDRAWGDIATFAMDSSSSRDLPLLTALYPDLGWTAYAQSTPRVIMSDALPSRNVEVAVLSFLGAPGRIAFFPIGSGRLPLDGERDACALDQDTAFRLFGSIDPGEESIRLDEKTVHVVGVIDIHRPLVLVPAEPDGAFDRLAADDRGALLTLASALRIEPDPFALSGAEWAKIAWLLCALPWLLAAMLVLAAFRKRSGRWRIAGTALFCALMLGALLALLMCVPVRLLPARWSDFAFYGGQIASWKARPFRAPDVRDDLISSDMLRVALFSMTACIALWLGKLRRSRELI